MEPEPEAYCLHTIYYDVFVHFFPYLEIGSESETVNFLNSKP
jgi:hypothetical protein